MKVFVNLVVFRLIGGPHSIVLLEFQSADGLSGGIGSADFR